MHYTTALSLYLLAVAGPASTFGQDMVTVWESATAIVTVTVVPGQGVVPTPPAGVEEKLAVPAPPASSSSAPPPPPPAASSSAPASPGGGGNGGGKLKSSNGQICINFSGNNDFHFLNTGSWGSKSGSGSDSASQCFDPSENAAMFICENECQYAGDAATAKYTKLECTLGGKYQNCDISLVDGFSLPVECTIPGALPAEKIGGLTDLDSLNGCPTTGDDNTCKNANAYEPEASAVHKYFQDANWNPQSPNGNNYCVFQFCGPQSDTFFSDQPTIECVVGYRNGGKSSKRDIDATASQREAGIAARSHKHRHSHAHAHVRGLKDLGV